MHKGNLKASKTSDRGLALTQANSFLTLLTQIESRVILKPNNLCLGTVNLNLCSYMGKFFILVDIHPVRLALLFSALEFDRGE